MSRSVLLVPSLPGQGTSAPDVGDGREVPPVYPVATGAVPEGGPAIDESRRY
jgi:hypothetical protein